MGTSEIKISPPRIVAWEVTRTCMMSCCHCRAGASNKHYEGELSTEECFKVIDSLAECGISILILTGGEPMVRDDIYEIVTYSKEKGLRVVMAPCGLLLNIENCRKLLSSGISRISLSLDGANERTHDFFRGMSGAFSKLIEGIKAAKETGLSFQINTTITKSNLGELPDIYELTLKLGAVSFHPFLLVPTGRGKELAEDIVEGVEYEKALHWIYEKQLTSQIPIKPTCAPHYYRIVAQHARDGNKIKAKEESIRSLDTLTKGCLGGLEKGFCFISHTGIVQICGFLPVEAGNLRKSNFNFRTIWENSPLLLEIRNIDGYHGKCGVCEYKMVCGGCRARAFAIKGDYLGEEPFCFYKPIGKGYERIQEE